MHKQLPIVVLLTTLLLYTSIQAQPGKESTKQITITRTQDGKTITIDTTIEISGESIDLKKLLEELDITIEVDQLNLKEIEVMFDKSEFDRSMKELKLALSPPKNPMLGIYLDKKQEGTGVRVMKPIPGMGAEAAGLAKDDVIIRIDKEDINTTEDIGKYLKTKQAGDEVKVNYLRNGKKKTAKVELRQPTESQKEEASWFRMQHPVPPMPPMPPMPAWKYTGKGAFLGVTYNETDGKGVLVTSVVSGSSAEKAGIQAKDILVEMDGKPISKGEDLSKAMSEHAPGDTVHVVYLRNEERLSSTAVLGNREKEYMVAKSMKSGAELENQLLNMKAMMEELRANMGSTEAMENLEQLEGQLEELMKSIEQDIKVYTRQHTDHTGKVSKVVLIFKVEDLSKEEAEKLNISPNNDLELTGLKISPNPNDGNMAISFTAPQRGDLHIRVMDMSGRDVYTYTLTDFEGAYSGSISLNGKDKGMYVIHITQNGKALSRKVVVQ
jgi:C-terminal processing protease CtpA/Prc